MTVQELIDELEKVTNKNVECMIYTDGQLFYPQMIDDNLGDRVDINCVSGVY